MMYCNENAVTWNLRGELVNGITAGPADLSNRVVSVGSAASLKVPVNTLWYGGSGILKTYDLVSRSQLDAMQIRA